MEIEVLSWSKYNPRKDIKSMPWFKLQSDIGYSEDLFELKPEQKWLWIFILSTCARKLSGTIKLSIDYITHYSGVDKEIIEETLQVFGTIGLVRITDASVRIPSESVCKRREEERREEENRQDATTDRDRVIVINSNNNLFHEITKLWNETHGAKLNKRYAMPSAVDIQNYKITQGYLPDIESWQNLFEKCEGTKLMGTDENFKCSWFGLGWLFKNENAANVINGQWEKITVKTNDSGKKNYTDAEIDKILTGK